jgi:micrococcal nuclease
MDRSLRLIPVLTAAVFIWGFSANAACPVRDSETTVRGKVSKVSDGDTIRVTVGSKNFAVRFLSIDTPETHYEGQTQGFWAEAASKRLTALLAIGTEVELQLDREKCDGYDRVLAYVFKGREMVNETMITEGLAVTYCIYPNIAHCDRLAGVVRGTMQARTGMFSDPALELPYDFRRRVSNRPYEKWVGNLKSKAVLSPEKVGSVPVWDRIFFMHKEDIEPPYFFAVRD